MERVDETLKGIDERLDRIEVKLDAPRRALATLWGTAVGRILMLLTTLLLAHAAATAGIAGWLPFIGP
jgi:tetrahydromethanopterin S-methyltransferase subunit G